VAYWSFRLMIGLGLLPILLALLGFWLTRRGRLPRNRWFWWASVWSLGLPLAANSFGWIFTEMGRQPWVVFGLLHTATGVSPSVAGSQVATSLIALTALYSVLAVVEVALLLRFAKAGPPPVPVADESTVDRPLTFAY
jgi:cytochrome d ubiquinol oxidase subunit I